MALIIDCTYRFWDWAARSVKRVEVVENRSMAAFCAEDPRLLPVALLSLDDPERAATELDLALELGCRGVWVPCSRLASCCAGLLEVDRPGVCAQGG